MTRGRQLQRQLPSCCRRRASQRPTRLSQGYASSDASLGACEQLPSCEQLPTRQQEVALLLLLLLLLPLPPPPLLLLARVLRLRRLRRLRLRLLLLRRRLLLRRQRLLLLLLLRMRLLRRLRRRRWLLGERADPWPILASRASPCAASRDLPALSLARSPHISRQRDLPICRLVVGLKRLDAQGWLRIPPSAAGEKRTISTSR